MRRGGKGARGGDRLGPRVARTGTPSPPDGREIALRGPLGAAGAPHGDIVIAGSAPAGAAPGGLFTEGPRRGPSRVRWPPKGLRARSRSTRPTWTMSRSPHRCSRAAAPTASRCVCNATWRAPSPGRSRRALPVRGPWNRSGSHWTIAATRSRCGGRRDRSTHATCPPPGGHIRSSGSAAPDRTRGSRRLSATMAAPWSPGPTAPRAIRACTSTSRPSARASAGRGCSRGSRIPTVCPRRKDHRASCA